MVNQLSTERLEALLDRASRVRVLVVGDLMLDVYLRGGASRISPEAPVPVVKVEEEWSALGGAANVAANVVALGASCTVVGCIGNDPAGSRLQAELEQAGIGTAGLTITADRPTTVKTRIMARHYQVARYDRESEDEADAASALALANRVTALAPDYDVIAIEDYDKGVLVPPVIAAALGRSRPHGRPVVVDPKARSFFEYGGATVFKPNLAELSAALRAPARPHDTGWLRATRAHLQCHHLLLTLGEEGMALLTAEEEHVHVPTVARSVYDVSGAGDTVTAAVAIAIAAGASAREAAVFANHAAGIEVGKAGVTTVSPDELRAFVRAHEENAPAVMPEN
jgi:D-beta-D-heptose 7-phosphate kinase/D-beta-D-heptose 1-phosphate adenosyltransferase